MAPVPSAPTRIDAAKAVSKRFFLLPSVFINLDLPSFSFDRRFVPLKSLDAERLASVYATRGCGVREAFRSNRKEQRNSPGFHETLRCEGKRILISFRPMLCGE